MRNSSEISKIVIGKILHKPDYYFDNYQLLHAGLFSDHVDRGVFKTIKKKLDQSLPVDEGILIAEAKDTGLIERIVEYSNMAFTTTNFLNCVEMLNEASKKESIRNLGADMVASSNNGKPARDIIEEVQGRLSKIRLDSKSDIADSSKQLKEYIDDIEKRMKTDGPLGVPSGIQSLDKFTG